MKKTMAIVSVLLAAVLGLFVTGCGESKTKIGVQAGTTGEFYVKGNADMLFDGYANLDCMAYQNGGLAFGAFLRQGQKITLRGEANDYLGKGLSGGTLAVCPPEGARWSDGDALIGNVALYGATSGAAYIAGAAGERFCVRNSGAAAVAEGVGDHGCEYMTGGRAAILGPVGDNFAAGMSGGVAYVLDEGDTLARRIHAGALEIGPVTGAWAEELKGMLQAHARLTGSPKAASLLSRWEKALPAFKMVIPTEYKRAMGGR